jgi:hypothetical protein
MTKTRITPSGLLGKLSRKTFLFKSLILATLFVPLAATRAASDAWSFNLVSAPVALNINSPGHESVRMTGAGTFDTGEAGGVVKASGAYELFNAFDHPNGPIVRGTWRATGFISFSNGMLKIEIETHDNVGGGVGTGELWVTTDGIAGPIYAGEDYEIPTGGSGGSVSFHEHGNAP